MTGWRQWWSTSSAWTRTRASWWCFVARSTATRSRCCGGDGASLVLAHKRLEHGRFIWPSVRDGMIRLRRTEFEVLFAGLDWRRMLDPEVRTRNGAP